MSLIAKKTSSFEPAPEGLWPAVCVDVVDLGMVEGQFGTKHKCRIVWEISERMKSGDPYIASKQYTVSLHEKSALHKDLKSWRGKAFTPEELAGFDVERVIGAPCQLLIAQEEKDGSVYANIQAVTKADKRNIVKPTGKYVRMKDREPKQANGNGHGINREAGDEDAFAGEQHADADPAYDTGEAIPF